MRNMPSPMAHYGKEEKDERANVISNLKGRMSDGRRRYGSSDSFVPGLVDDVALNCLAWASRSDYASLSCINTRFNKLIKSGYLYGLREQLGIVEHWVYLVCDLKGWEAFDPVRKKWMTLPKMPCDECFNHADKESLAVGSQLLVFGRELLDFAIWKYSAIYRSWIKCQGMNQPRCLFGSGSLGSIAIVAGGSDRNGNVLKSAEIYDSVSGRWEMLPNMHTPRRLCTGFFWDGKFYVMGGMSSPNDSLTCGEEYDLETGKWRKIEGMYPSVNIAAQAPPLCAVVDNQLYAVVDNPEQNSAKA
ncbi:F-box/kelch-repeat protein At5g60570-like, partial [Malus sylvestris]|uniref:F-box/kelch-repeat protein At5g60570-like n=1 Tax=Malus sylvestris TaxID=3752 RepID=UPI0021ABBC07